MRARALALWSGAAITLALLSTNPAPRALLLLLTFNVCLATRQPGRSVRPLLTGIVLASLCAVAFNALLSHTGSDVVVTIPAAVPVFGGPVTLEGMLFGGGIALGISTALLAAAPLGLALEPHELIGVLPRRLERTGTALATALTLVPALGNSFTAVRDSQRLRGWEPRGPRSWFAVLTPVAVGAMERSLQVAESMEARGYGSGRRTRLPGPRGTSADLSVAVSAVLAVVVGVAARVTGHNPDWLAYPRPELPSVDLLALLGPILLITPLLLWRRPTSRG